MYSQWLLRHVREIQLMGHPFYHFCRKCLNGGKVLFIAVVVEAVTFWPTHYIFERLGWL